MSLSVSLGQQRQIDRICNDFEETWQGSVPPDFTVWLAMGESAILDQLLKQLIQVDVELRLRTGHAMMPDDYSRVHHSAPKLVLECLAMLDQTHAVHSAHNMERDQESVTSEISRLAGPAGMIGPYELLKKIGEGGMGSVWLAEQHEPIRRQVALKVIRSGSRSAEIVSRFQSERQALAKMDHSNIARILDVGTTSDHQPYFAMELVHGLTLTAYCDQKRLGIHDRLKLLVDVCSGVHHAHQKGVIHRDLKPLNVLVVDVDGLPVPKVIDFGMAKALDNSLRLADQSACTAVGQVLGTFKYMSPEQACVDEADIDVRTDVYALGIILYELLTGSTPLASESLVGQPLLAILEKVRDHEPVKPSSRVLNDNSSLQGIADRRRTDGNRLVRTLNGELDWIVLKALERNPERRYESVLDFSADIQRFLNHEPVLARPSSAVYRARKFVRKYRLPVLAGSLMSLILIAGMIGTGWGMLVARQRAEGERLAKISAQRRLLQVREGNQLLLRIFADLDIRVVRNDGQPLEAILAKRLVSAARRLKGEVIGDSIEVATMQSDLGVTLVNFGFPADAIPLFQESLQTRSRLLGENALDSINSRRQLAGAYGSVGEWERARELFDAAYRISYQELGENHLLTMSAMFGLSKSLQNTGNFDEALPLMEESVRLGKLELGVNHRDTLSRMWGLAGMYREVGKYEDALNLFQETYREMKLHLGPTHPDTLETMASLAMARLDNGDTSTALTLMEDCFRLRANRFGVDHAQSILFMNDVAECRVRSGLGAQNVSFCRETLEAIKAKFGENDPAVIFAMENLALACRAAGELNEAKSLLEQTLKRCEAARGKLDWHTHKIRGNLGQVCLEAGMLKEAIDLLKAVQPEQHDYPYFLWTEHLLRKACLLSGEFEEFYALADQHLQAARNKLPASSPKLADFLAEMGSQFVEFGDYPEAKSLLRECVQIRETIAPDTWGIFQAKLLLGASLLGLEQFEEAEPLLIVAFDGLADQREKIPPDQKGSIEQVVRRIILLYEKTNRPNDAEEWRSKLEELANGKNDGGPGNQSVKLAFPKVHRIMANKSATNQTNPSRFPRSYESVPVFDEPSARFFENDSQCHQRSNTQAA